MRTKQSYNYLFLIFALIKNRIYINIFNKLLKSYYKPAHKQHIELFLQSNL